MLSFIKNLFRDTRSPEVVSKSSSSDVVPELSVTAPAPVASAAVKPDSSAPAAILQLPLKPVVDKMPRTLLAHVHRPPAAADRFDIPLAMVLAQLPSGSVKVSFRDVKLSATPGVFTAASDADETVVELPLGEILPRIQPGHLARRREQKAVVVPSDFAPVFRTQSDAPSSQTILKPLTHAQAAMASRPVAFPQPSRVPVAVATEAAPAPTTSAPTPPSVKVTTLKAAAHSPSHGGPDRPLNGAGLKAAGPRPSTEDREPIKVPLTVVARNWPDPVRSEIVAAHFAASLLIPYADLEAALKRGRAIFAWKLIRSWLTPKGTSELHGYNDLTLELPLAVLAPMFVGRWSSTRTVNTVAPQDVPDVFLARKKDQAATVPAPATPTPTPGPTPPTIATVAVAPTPVAAPALAAVAPAAPKVPVAPAITLSPQAPIKMPSPSAPAPAPRTAPPQPQNLAPKAIVERASGLEGVAGALVATHDGLIIATQLPAGINGEALGAFVPQIFNRLAPYTSELKFDSPTQIQMLLGKTPLLLIKTPLAFFGVLGKPSQTLPQTELGALADQLSSGKN